MTLVYGLYEYPDSPKIEWDYLDDGTNGDGVYWAAVRLNGFLFVVLRGSVTKLDWQRDFDCVELPFDHPGMGTVHPGFLKGLDLVCAKVLEIAKPNEQIIVCGHSLGAGRATLLTGLLVLAGRLPAARIVFGEPRSCTGKLQKILQAVPIMLSYENEGATDEFVDHDFVCDVPPWLDHGGSITHEVVEPLPNDPWMAFKYHHAYLYAKAVGIQQTWSR